VRTASFLVFSLASLASLAACSSKPEGTIQLVTGGETDTMTRAPAPTSLLVEAIDGNGKATTLARVSWPTDSIDLGDQSQDTVAVVRVTGFDASGAPRVRGTSVPVQLGGLAGSTLDVFVQRAGELARLPSPLSDARPSPLVAPVIGRYLFVAGGSDPSTSTTSQLYDLATYTATATPPALPRAPLSMAMLESRALLIDAAGATWLELADGSHGDASVPSGGTFAEVAGGATVIAEDGSAYVVGATRTTGDPTPRVLHLANDGTVSFVSLTTPRKGAAATWLAGHGLVVAGGSASGAGVEVLAAGATTATALPFPSDAATGAGAAPLDAKSVVLLGGVDATMADAKVRVIDVTCAASCATSAWSAVIPTTLVRASAFAFVDGSALVVGDDAAGATHATRVTPTAVADVALKAARGHASTIVTPNGAVAIVGGAGVIESFVP
jgi:hypothetical protein